MHRPKKAWRTSRRTPSTGSELDLRSRRGPQRGQRVRLHSGGSFGCLQGNSHARACRSKEPPPQLTRSTDFGTSPYSLCGRLLRHHHRPCPRPRRHSRMRPDNRAWPAATNNALADRKSPVKKTAVENMRRSSLSSLSRVEAASWGGGGRSIALTDRRATSGVGEALATLLEARTSIHSPIRKS
jgi:hypothetical protein